MQEQASNINIISTELYLHIEEALSLSLSLSLKYLVQITEKEVIKILSEKYSQRIKTGLEKIKTDLTFSFDLPKVLVDLTDLPINHCPRRRLFFIYMKYSSETILFIKFESLSFKCQIY